MARSHSDVANRKYTVHNVHEILGRLSIFTFVLGEHKLKYAHL